MGTSERVSVCMEAEADERIEREAASRSALIVSGCLCAASLAAGLSFLWLVFGYGMCDPQEGRGYLSVAVVLGLSSVGAAAFLLSRHPRRVDAAVMSKPLLIAAGIACTLATVPLVTNPPVSVSEQAKWALNIVESCSIVWCVFAAARSLAECATNLRASLMLHLALVFAFAFNSLVFLDAEGGLGATVVFCALPVVAALLLIAAHYVRGGTLSSVADDGGAPAREPAASPADDRTLARFAIGLLAFCAFIAFVRSSNLDLSEFAVYHGAGSSVSIGLLGLFGIAMVLYLVLTRRTGFVAWYYLVGVSGICFCSLVLIVPGHGNHYLAIVRVVENVSYILFFFSMLYAIIAHARRTAGSASVELLRAFALIAFGNALGWIAQMGLARIMYDSTAAGMVLLVLSFALLLYFLVGFPLGEYRRLTGEERPVSMAPSVLVPAVAGVSVPGVAASADEPSEAFGREQHHHMNFKEAAGRVAKTYGLSPRETDILFMLIKGYSDQRIADETVTSYNTVRSHIRHIYTKSDVHNRDELLDLIATEQASGE